MLSGCHGNLKTERKCFEISDLTHKIIQLDSNDCYIYTEYYKNGNHRIRGVICDEIKKGNWKEWYLDGELKWEGFFTDSIREVNFNKQTPKISVIGSASTFYPDTTYFIKVTASGIHPEDMIITSNNGKIQLPLNRDECDFAITPKRPGDLALVLYVIKDQQMHLIGKTELKVVSR